MTQEKLEAQFSIDENEHVLQCYSYVCEKFARKYNLVLTVNN